MRRFLYNVREAPWRLLAKVVSKPAVVEWLIRRAQKTPYFHLDGYMNRWWLFNGYGNDRLAPEQERHNRKYKWLPSIRIHHILREDFARDPHDHPWNARTIILKGSYHEDRLMLGVFDLTDWRFVKVYEHFIRKPGDTASLKYGEYHNITEVSADGVWTLFFTWKYMGDWGFWVDGEKVPHKEYKDGGAA